MEYTYESIPYEPYIYEPCYSIITAGSEIGKDMEIFYKGKKVINAVELKIHGLGLEFEEKKKTNWRKRLHED